MNGSCENHSTMNECRRIVPSIEKSLFNMHANNHSGVVFHEGVFTRQFEKKINQLIEDSSKDSSTNAIIAKKILRYRKATYF